MWLIISPRSHFFKRKMWFAFRQDQIFTFASRHGGSVSLPINHQESKDFRITALENVNFKHVDCAYVCTSYTGRKELLTQLCGQVPKILVEKTPCLERKDSLEILELAEKTGTKIYPQFQPMFGSMWKTLEPSDSGSVDFLCERDPPLSQLIWEIGWYGVITYLLFNPNREIKRSFIHEHRTSICMLLTERGLWRLSAWDKLRAYQAAVCGQKVVMDCFTFPSTDSAYERSINACKEDDPRYEKLRELWPKIIELLDDWRHDYEVSINKTGCELSNC